MWRERRLEGEEVEGKEKEESQCVHDYLTPHLFSSFFPVPSTHSPPLPPPHPHTLSLSFLLLIHTLSPSPSSSSSTHSLPLLPPPPHPYRFLCILQLLVQDSEDRSFLPSIITFVMNHIYPIVSKVHLTPSTPHTLHPHTSSSLTLPTPHTPQYTLLSPFYPLPVTHPSPLHPSLSSLYLSHSTPLHSSPLHPYLSTPHLPHRDRPLRSKQCYMNFSFNCY